MKIYRNRLYFYTNHDKNNFIYLFIVVADIVKVGLISKLSDNMISLTKPAAENIFTTAIITLWFSAIASTVMENTILIASIIFMKGKM